MACAVERKLPFLIVQLPQWIDKKVDKGDGDPMLWPVLREAQWDAAQSIDNVFAICTMDCGEYNNIHPVDKRTPGERLGNCALRQVYGMSRIPVYGPTVLGFRCDEGGRVRLFFRYAHGLHFSGTTPDSFGDEFAKSLPSLVRLPERSVSSLPVPMVCSIRPTPRFSWIAILTIWSTQRSTCRLQRHGIRYSDQQPQCRHDYVGHAGSASAGDDALRMA